MSLWSLLIQLCILLSFFSSLSRCELWMGTRLWDAAKKQGAKCLDGSEPHYFFRAGNEDNKWFIFYEGGGWCTPSSTYVSNAFDSCSYRSTQYMGSTRMDTTTLDLSTGYFSQDPSINPLMANFNMVYIRYCDGSSFTSNKTDTFVQDGKTLFFRGSRIREAVANDLLAYKNLRSATDVIIGGCSAGGLAANIALDWWAQKLPSTTRLTGFLDSSFFLPIDKSPKCMYKSGIKDLATIMNSVGALNKACVAAKSSDPTECMFAQTMDPFVKTSMFAMQPKFDEWQLWAEACSNSPNDLNTYGTSIYELFKINFVSNHPNRGGFVDSCKHHCWKYGDLVADGTKNSVAFKEWYDKNTEVVHSQYWIDSQSYGCSNCCQ